MNAAHSTPSLTELVWFKSSYSGPDGDDCIEVATSWRKSSHSGSDGDNCIEVVPSPRSVHVRDSKNKCGGPQLTFTPEEWAAFVAYAAGH